MKRLELDAAGLPIPEPPRNIDRELVAMRAVFDALEPLSPQARVRVLRAVCILLDIPELEVRGLT